MAHIGKRATEWMEELGLLIEQIEPPRCEWAACHSAATKCVRIDGASWTFCPCHATDYTKKLLAVAGWRRWAAVHQERGKKHNLADKVAALDELAALAVAPGTELEPTQSWTYFPTERHIRRVYGE